MVAEVSGGVEVAVRRFTVADYHRMGKAGVFRRGERVELLDGEIIEMNPVGRPHATTVNRLNRLFARLFGDRVLLSIQNPVVLDTYAEPQPDVVVLRPREDDYLHAAPTGADTYLVVEVADSTVTYDTTRKARAYARTGVSLFWVVVVGRGAEDRVIMFADPADGEYRSIREARRGDALTIPGLGDAPVAVGDFL